MRADDMIREIDPSVELTVTDLTFAPKTTCLRTKNVKTSETAVGHENDDAGHRADQRVA